MSITIFHDDKIPKDGSQCICQLVILIDCVFRTGKSCYTQMFFEEGKYVFKERKIPKYIIDGISRGHSDGEDSDKKILIKRTILILPFKEAILKM